MEYDDCMACGGEWPFDEDPIGDRDPSKDKAPKPDENTFPLYISG